MGTTGVCPTQPREIRSRHLASPDANTAASPHRISAPTHKVQRHSSTLQPVPQQLQPLHLSTAATCWFLLVCKLASWKAWHCFPRPSLFSGSGFFFFFFLFCFHPALPRVIPRNVTSISACPRKQAQINHCYMCITGVVQGQTCWLWKTQPPLLSHSRTVRALQNHAPGMCK